MDRAALVAELADQIRDAISSGERWAPDYDALMERTGFRRSWCEKAVRDARTAAFSAPQRRRRPYGRRCPYRPAARTGGIAKRNRPGRGNGLSPSAAPRPSPGGIPIMSADTTPGHGTAPEPAGPDTGDGDHDADVLFLPARDAAPAPDGGNAGRGGQPPALPPAPVTGPTTTTTMTTT